MPLESHWQATSTNRIRSGKLPGPMMRWPSPVATPPDRSPSRNLNVEDTVASTDSHPGAEFASGKLPGAMVRWPSPVPPPPAAAQATTQSRIDSHPDAEFVSGKTPRSDGAVAKSSGKRPGWSPSSNRMWKTRWPGLICLLVRSLPVANSQA